jgi:putative oxidoreductase
MSIAFGLLILRLVVGLTLAAHGAQKLFGWWGGSGMKGWTQMVEKLRIRPAKPWAWVAALSEFGGGLLFALGLLSPLGSFAIMALLAAVAAVALTGPGAYSLDVALGIRLPEPLILIAGTIAVIAGVAITLATRAPQDAAQAKPQTN